MGTLHPSVFNLRGEIHQIQSRKMLHLLPEIRAKLNTDSAWREERSGGFFLRWCSLLIINYVLSMFVFSGSNLLFPQLLPLTPDSLSKHHRTNLNWFCISFLRGADRHHSVRSRHRGARLRNTCSSWQSQLIPLGKHGHFHLICYQNLFKWNKPRPHQNWCQWDLVTALTKRLWWYCGTEMPLFIVFCMLTQWRKINPYKSIIPTPSVHS